MTEGYKLLDDMEVHRIADSKCTMSVSFGADVSTVQCGEEIRLLKFFASEERLVY